MASVNSAKLCGGSNRRILGPDFRCLNRDQNWTMRDLRKGERKPLKKLERETGFEPATDGLGSRCATTALLPPASEYHTLSER